MSAELALPKFETLDLPAAMVRDLRSDLAGETGAVSIYRGMLANYGCRSRMLPAWRLSGWMLGAVAARMGRTFTFVTIEAAETFGRRGGCCALGLTTPERCNKPAAPVFVVYS